MSTPYSLTKRSDLLAIGLLVTLTMVIGLPILMEPWGADQAGFGLVAKGILEGKVPYRDFYSLTGYGVFFTFALFFKLFGMTMRSAHIGHLVVSLFTVILVYSLTLYLYGRKPAFIAALCYTLFSNGLAFSGFGYENKSAWGTYWYLSQREVFMAPLILGAVFLFVLSEKRDAVLTYFFTGILIGLASVYKVTALLMLFLFLLFLAFEHFLSQTNFDAGAVVRRMSSLLFGFILAQIPFLYYFWSHSALGDMYQALFLHVSLYAKLSRGLRIETLFSGHYSILSENLVIWLFAAIASLHIVFRNRTRNGCLIVLWTLGSLLMVWGQGKFFGYHFILLVPPFSILTGYAVPTFLFRNSGFVGMFRNAFTDIRQAFMLTTIMFTIIGFGISNYDYYKRHVLYLLGKMSRQTYYDVFNEFPTHPYSFRTDYEIAQYLRGNHKPGDKLGVIFSAGDTIVHFLSGLEPATRFIQSWYLFPSDEFLSRNEITVSLRREFVDHLINTAPKFILCVHIPLRELVQLPSLRDDPSVIRLDEFVHENYKLETFPDNRFLFKRI